MSTPASGFGTVLDQLVLCRDSSLAQLQPCSWKKSLELQALTTECTEHSSTSHSKSSSGRPLKYRHWSALLRPRGVTSERWLAAAKQGTGRLLIVNSRKGRVFKICVMITCRPRKRGRRFEGRVRSWVEFAGVDSHPHIVSDSFLRTGRRCGR
jgi:hypothetical protein